MEKSFTCSSKDGDFQRSILIHSPMGNDKFRSICPFFLLELWDLQRITNSFRYVDSWNILFHKENETLFPQNWQPLLNLLCFIIGCNILVSFPILFQYYTSRTATLICNINICKFWWVTPCKKDILKEL